MTILSARSTLCYYSSGRSNLLYSEQDTLKNQLILHDEHDWTLDTLLYVGGLDISADDLNINRACATFTVMSFPDMELLYQDTIEIEISIPYVPGFLAFREVPFYLDLIRRNTTQYQPQVILIDGNGILHTREFGCACHLGVLTGIPTIGVGKTFFYIDGITRAEVKKQSECLSYAGDSRNIVGKSGKVWGAMMRATEDSKQPLIISIGHKMSLDTAIDIVYTCCKFRVPEPIRQADRISRAALK